MSTLAELRALGGIVADEPVKKTIAFKIDGTEFEAVVHVKRLSVGEHERLFGVLTAARVSEDEDSRTAKMLSEVIRLGDDGKEQMSFQDAYRLHVSVATAMMRAVNEVNGLAEKNSLPPIGSSTISH